MTQIEKHSKMTRIWTPHRIFPKQRRRTAPLNPTPNDSPEGFQWSKMLFIDFCICFGSKGSFLFGFVDSHGQRGLDGTAGSGRRERVSDLLNPRRCAWVSGRIWRGRLGFWPDLAKSSGFLAGSGQNPRSASLSSWIQREIRPEYHVFWPFLSSSLFSVTGRCVWVTDLSSSLSFSVAI